MLLERIIEAFPALNHRDFRLFWTGQCISLIGTWMQNVGQSWLVLQLTGSAWLLGIVSALQFLPMLFLSVFAGVVVDRFPKRRILVFTQSMLMLLALGLALLVWTGAIRYWEIVGMALLLGVVNTVDQPTRQAYVIEMVGKEDLMNAIALNSSIFNAARVIGPAIAGLLMSFLSIAACFFINSLSFVAVIINLLKMSKRPAAVRPKELHVVAEIKEGLRFARGNSNILSILLMVAVVSIFALNFNVLVPVFAQRELGQSAGGYGLLISAIGAGALAGAIFMAAVSQKGPKLELLGRAGMALGILLIAFGWQRSYLTSLFLLAFSGFFMILFSASANTSVQLSTPDNLRGRVMSLYTMVFAGFSPIGSLFAGWMANMLGAGETSLVFGLVVFGCLVLLRFARPELESAQTRVD